MEPTMSVKVMTLLKYVSMLRVGLFRIFYVSSSPLWMEMHMVSSAVAFGYQCMFHRLQ